MKLYYSGGWRSKTGAPEFVLDQTNLTLSYEYLTTVENTVKERLNRVVKQRGSEQCLPIGIVESHFLDSGAFTLQTRAKEYAKEHCCSIWDFYDTRAHWKYVDDYAAFVKKYHIAIDLFANVDVIPNPELTWRNQKYLEEKHGLTPVPVVHYRTPLKWLRKYIKAGYELIGLGGLVGSTSQQECRAWIDSCFDLVCDQPSRLPRVKLHGFGVTTFDLLVRYPWWSVDSTSWTMVAAFGGIIIPHKRKGKFVFTETPYIVKVSSVSPTTSDPGRHYSTLSRPEREIVSEWLGVIGLPLGRPDGELSGEGDGVMVNHSIRRAANILFFERLMKELPEWPWSFWNDRPKGLWE